MGFRLIQNVFDSKCIRIHTQHDMIRKFLYAIVVVIKNPARGDENIDSAGTIHVFQCVIGLQLYNIIRIYNTRGKI